MKKLIDIKEISQKEKIALLATVAVLLMVITRVCYNLSSSESNGIDYNRELNINNIINISDESTDRKVYLILEDIIQDFLTSYNLELEDYAGDFELSLINYKRKDYYRILAGSYKKKLNRFKYNKLSKEFMSKFVVSNEYGRYVKTSDILQNIYELDSYMYSANMYICKLSTATENEYVYIGIQLEETTNECNIFYLGVGENFNE